MKVSLLMAITLDGKIGKSADHFPDWTGKEDKKLFVRLSRDAGVVIMGSKTFDTFGKPLPGRKNVILTRNTSRKSEWDNLVYTDRPPETLVADLEAEGFSRVILAGGAQVNTLFARKGLIDEVLVTICPMIFGRGISLFTEDVEMELDLKTVEKISDQVVYLTYNVVR